MSPLYTTLSRAPFSPSRLFRAMEQGLWYDPSDLTPEKIAWRRNLVTYSEGAAATWAVSNVTDAGTPITGFSNSLQFGDNSAQRTAYKTVGVTISVAYTVSVFVQMDDGNAPVVGGTNTTGDFSLVAGNGQRVSAAATITRISGNLYHVSGTTTASATNATAQSGVIKYVGQSSRTFRVIGIQVEASATATEYQKLTDFNSDFLAVYPYHTLFQDAAGTTPMTALGQSVGLVLDKRLGLELGPELVSNGDFATSDGWALQTEVSISGGSLNFNTTATRTATYTGASCVSGRWYVIEFDMTYTSGIPRFDAGGGSTNISQTTGHKHYIRQATGTNDFYFTCSSGGGAYSVGNISVRELPGNHAYQTTAASRPTVEARVNLLTESEFRNGVTDAILRGGPMTATTFPEVTNNTGLSFGHDGVTTAYAYKSYAGYVAGVTYTLSFLIRMTDNGVPVVGGSTSQGDLRVLVNNIGVPVSDCTVTSLGSGLYKVTATIIATSTTGNTGVIKYNSQSSRTFTTSGWMLEEGTTATTYQRVNTATYYADIGAPRYLSFDGVDDFMVTDSINFTSTDKMTVWAGVRKLSDAASGTLVELGASASSNGHFAVFAPISAPTTDFTSRSRGTLLTAVTASGYTAPITSVLCADMAIGDDRNILRINGTQAASSSADQGTGNYGNYPLYIGRRGGTSLPFKGHLYGLIIRGAASNADQIATAEAWMNSKTRAY